VIIPDLGHVSREIVSSLPPAFGGFNSSSGRIKTYRGILCEDNTLFETFSDEIQHQD